MLIELHILQNFAPSNLNRDESNAPKDCIFGGVRRSRISSQCFKRNIRRHPDFAKAIEGAAGDMGVRTKRLKHEMTEVLVAAGRKSAEAEKVVEAAIRAIGLKMSKKDKEKTEYLLYFGKQDISALAAIVGEEKNWTQLLKGAEALASMDEAEGKEDDGGKSRGKKKTELPKEIKELRNKLTSVIAGDRTTVKSYAADIALYGRMIADDKSINVDGACQVAHAVSVNRATMEMDFFTAVDDLLPEGESGSDMMGTVEFVSPCVYRYSVIDVDSLRKNLGQNADLLKATVKGFLNASIKAIPTGKQNSMAAHNLPGYARAIVRSENTPCSFVNAFQVPINSGNGRSIEELAIDILNAYSVRIERVYGAGSKLCDESFNIYDNNTKSMEDIIGCVVNAVEAEVGA